MRLSDLSVIAHSCIKLWSNDNKMGKEFISSPRCFGNGAQLNRYRCHYVSMQCLAMKLVIRKKSNENAIQLIIL